MILTFEPTIAVKMSKGSWQGIDRRSSLCVAERNVIAGRQILLHLAGLGDSKLHYKTHALARVRSSGKGSTED